MRPRPRSAPRRRGPRRSALWGVALPRPRVRRSSLAASATKTARGCSARCDEGGTVRHREGATRWARREGRREGGKGGRLRFVHVSSNHTPRCAAADRVPYRAPLSAPASAAQQPAPCRVSLRSSRSCLPRSTPPLLPRRPPVQEATTAAVQASAATPTIRICRTTAPAPSSTRLPRTRRPAKAQAERSTATRTSRTPRPQRPMRSSNRCSRRTNSSPRRTSRPRRSCSSNSSDNSSLSNRGLRSNSRNEDSNCRCLPFVSLPSLLQRSPSARLLPPLSFRHANLSLQRRRFENQPRRKACPATSIRPHARSPRRLRSALLAQPLLPGPDSLSRTLMPRVSRSSSTLTRLSHPPPLRRPSRPSPARARLPPRPRRPCPRDPSPPILPCPLVPPPPPLRSARSSLPCTPICASWRRVPQA